MTWWLSAIVLFGVLTAFFLMGLAAAFAFFGINIVGAWFYLEKEAGLVQLIRNGIVSITSFSLTPIPFFILMGEVLFHTGVAMKAIDGIDPGVLLSVMFVAWIVLRAMLDPSLAPAFEHEEVSSWERLKPLLLYVVPLVLIFVV